MQVCHGASMSRGKYDNWQACQGELQRSCSGCNDLAASQILHARGLTDKFYVTFVSIRPILSDGSVNDLTALFPLAFDEQSPQVLNQLILEEKQALGL